MGKERVKKSSQDILLLLCANKNIQSNRFEGGIIIKSFLPCGLLLSFFADSCAKNKQNRKKWGEI